MSDPNELNELCAAFASLLNPEEFRRFLLDLCTPAELAAMADRWKAAKLLKQGLSYRDIYEKSGVSTATVTRVARSLNLGAGGYQLLLNRMNQAENKRSPRAVREKALEREERNTHRAPNINRSASRAPNISKRTIL